MWIYLTCNFGFSDSLLGMGLVPKEASSEEIKDCYYKILKALDSAQNSFIEMDAPEQVRY